MENTIHRTVLFEDHQARGAKMMEFGGFELPAWFSSLKEEHMAVRERAGCFDISHMGVLLVSGENAFSFLQKIGSNDMEKAAGGKMIYSMVLNENGGVKDDIMVGKLDEVTHVMVVNASNKDKLLAWFSSVGTDGVVIEDLSVTHGFMAVQGPEALGIFDPAFGTSFAQKGRFEVFRYDLNGVKTIVMRTGYTGEDGFEIVVPNEDAVSVWGRIIESGIVPCGLGARDSLRLEAGLPLYGQELNEDITPLMTRYRWVLKWGTGFVGEAALAALKDEDPPLKMVGIEMVGKGIARSHYPIKEGGEVTSGTMLPGSGRAVGIAYVPVSCSEIGSPLHVEIRGKWVEAVVVKIPF